MPAERTCSQCGAPLPEDAPGGRCPKCLVQLALEESRVGQDDLSLAPSLSPDGGECPRRAGKGPTPITNHESPITLPRQRYFGDYELLEEIARGGMGVVYKARQVSLNRIVAVKMILAGQLASAGQVQRFRHEAEATANLQHPNIVAIHEVGEHEGQQYFSMDYVEGKDLAELLRDHPLPARRSAGYLKSIAEAIHYAHQRGILHRDLKPSNVLIDQFDQPRITDFGLAKRIASLEADVRKPASKDNAAAETDHRQTAPTCLTSTGQVLGTPNYMSPEQAEGKHSQATIASDIYSLGAILYHLLTGRPPFAAETFGDTLRELLHSEPVSPRILNPNVPRDLETICLKCLRKEANDRYSSAAALAEDLQRWLAGDSIRARPISLAESLWRWARGQPGRKTMGVLLAAAGLLNTISLILEIGEVDGLRWPTALRAAIVGTLFGLAPLVGGALLLTTVSSTSRCRNCGSADFESTVDLRRIPWILVFGGFPNFLLLTRKRPFRCNRCGSQVYLHTRGTRVALTYVGLAALSMLLLLVVLLGPPDSPLRVSSGVATDVQRGPGKSSAPLPMREPQANSSPVNLLSYYNATLQGSPGQSNHLASLPTGVHEFAGTQFNVHGLIQLSSKGNIRLTNRYPDHVDGIQIGRRCTRLHFLHAGVGSEKNGVKVGQYVVHYATGPDQEIPLVYAEDLRVWWRYPNNSKSIGRAVLAWTGTNAASAAHNATLRLFKLTWDNPQPENAILSIDIVSGTSKCAPFVVAITTEP